MPSRIVLALLCFALLFAARPAGATYNEWHLTGSDVRVVVDRDAKARIEQHVAVRVVAGSLRSLSLPGYPADAVFEPEGKVTSDDGRTFALSVGRDGDAFAQAITQDALKRGDYTFELHYRVDLREGRLVSDGALSRVTLTTPPLNEGIDGARVVFDLPAAPTEPRLATDGQSGVLATLRRTADRDELELVRPHVSRGDAVTWAIRVDPAAISARVAPVRDAVAPTPRLDRGPIAALALGAVFACLWVVKRRTFESLAAQAGARVLGLPVWAGAPLLGLGVAGVVESRVLGLPILAGGLVALVSVASLLRARQPSKARGPGQWVALRAAEVFAPARTGLRALLLGGSSARPGDWLDARSSLGARVFGGVAAVCGIVSFVLARHDGAWDLPLALLFALAPIWGAATRAELAPDAARHASVLRHVWRHLVGDDSFKVTPWARLPALSEHTDELRLLVMPRAPIPGLFGVEVATAWERRAGSFVHGTEVLVRVHEDSPASAKMAALGAPSTPGRKPEERVFRFESSWPTAAGAADLARDWAARLVDRRVRGACIVAGLADRRAPIEARGPLAA